MPINQTVTEELVNSHALKRGELKQRLLNEIRRECAIHAPEAISIAQICKRLGVSSGAPFRVFTSREEIFATLIEQEMVKLQRLMIEATESPASSPKERLAALCHSYIDFAGQNSAMFRLSFSVSGQSLQSDSLARLGEEIFSFVTDTVAACYPENISRPTVERKAYLLWSTIHGHALLTMTRQQDDIGIESAGQSLVDDAVNALR